MQLPNVFSGINWDAYLPGLEQATANAVAAMAPMAYVAMGLLLAYLAWDWIVTLVRVFTRVDHDDD